MIRLSKRRKSATPYDQVITKEIINILDDDEADPQRVRVNVFEPLVNTFEGGVFGYKDKLD